MRTTPVAFFLGDAAFMADSKFRALYRRLPSEDDFNSAVGAFFVALAAARRNGIPELDVAAETGSRFVPDLLAVGLICETGFKAGPFKAWAAMAPQQVEAGRARAASAKRTPAGTFASALEPLDHRLQPSPPLTSVPLSPVASLVACAREDDPVGEALFGAYGGNPSTAVLQWGDRIAEQYGREEAAKAIGVALLDGRDKLMSRAEGTLKMAARHAEMAELEAEREKVVEGHRPLGLAEVVATPDPQKVGAILEGIRSSMGFHPVPEPGGKKP